MVFKLRRTGSKGYLKKRMLISTYICHPSMAITSCRSYSCYGINRLFRKKKLKKTLRFLFIPETIGSIVFIKKI